MVVFPNCKINIGLRILRKRNDGYHDLETLFYPLPLYDALEVISSSRKDFLFTSSGLKIEATEENNLCTKAYRLLKKDFPDLPAIHVHLHKAIPSGAGLGGGSSDASFMLLLLNKIFAIGLTTAQLATYGLQLGSDCPFFLINQPCIATGRGEILEPVRLDLSEWQFILIKPPVSISTAQAFSGIKASMHDKTIHEIIQQPLQSWKDELKNDFELTVFKQYPLVAEIREELYRLGAVYASLSGSGSTVYGMFPKDAKPTLSFPSDYFVKQLNRQAQ